jgi:hypothetical protein
MLQERFRSEVDRIQRAYGGLWRFFTFVGRKADDGQL